MKIVFENPNPLENSIVPRRHAFTLVELLVVISIIGVLAALTIPLAGSVARSRKISVAQAEMQQIETALENYKAKYGVYPPGNPNNAVTNQLYYELSGVTNTSTGRIADYQTLDNRYNIPGGSFTLTFGGAGGIVNCSKGSGEDAVLAEDFLPGLKSTQVTSATNSEGNLVPYLVTSVGGPDLNYQPLPGGNPFRYACPGTNNPNSYDLWVQLSIGSTFNGVNHFVTPKKNLICNWNQQVLLNSPMP